MRSAIAVILAAALAVSACRPTSSEDVSRPAAAEVPGADFTVWTTRVELFAEHPALVVGRPAKFAAHVTDLRDWSAPRAGRMELVLVGPGGETTATAEAPARPGIFQPVVTPTTPGEHHLRFRIVAPGLDASVDAGKVAVHADVASAKAAVGEEPEETDDAIAFLKEQQWKLPFMAAPVAAGDVEVGITLPGEVKPAGGREAVVAAPATGRLVVTAGRLPKLGDAVARGQVLAALTPDATASENRAGLAAALREAEAAHLQAESELTRASRLVAAELAPARRLEEARTGVAVARARVAAAQSRLRAKGATLAGAAIATAESYRLASPLAGTIVEARGVPGAHVEAGAPLFRVVDLRRVWVEGRAPEAEANGVAAARSAVITVPGATTRGTLVAVGAVLDSATRTAPALFEAANPAGALRIGMTARITAVTGTVRGPLVPASSLVDDNGKPTAYVQTGGESFERRTLALGPRSGDRVLVETGLRAGERVVTRGGYEIRLATLSDAVPAHGHEH